jgi:hypothetical protein
MRQIIKFLGVAFILLSGSRPFSAQSACVFEADRTISGEFDHSEYVVLATPIATAHMPTSADRYFLDGDDTTIRIMKVFKGPPAQSLNVFSENSSGRFPLELNEPYVLFLYQDHGRFQVDNCGHSGLAEKSRSVLRDVRALSVRSAAHR